jgi:molybdate transport system regulatory protein
MPIIGPLKIKAQVLCGADFAMGPGKAGLLEAIDSEGSISAAGRALGMSYRRAWLLVDTMNRCWSSPLVEATSGGGAHKGARLTATGRTVLCAYRNLEAALVQAASDPSAEVLQSLLLPVSR